MKLINQLAAIWGWIKRIVRRRKPEVPVPTGPQSILRLGYSGDPLIPVAPDGPSVVPVVPTTDWSQYLQDAPQYAKLPPDPLEWHSGPPPHVGWWNATFAPEDLTCQDIWRWWDGKRWSISRRERDKYQAAVLPGVWDDQIQWRWYYPENAVVPRMTPEQWKERARAST